MHPPRHSLDALLVGDNPHIERQARWTLLAVAALTMPLIPLATAGSLVTRSLVTRSLVTRALSLRGLGTRGLGTRALSLRALSLRALVTHGWTWCLSGIEAARR